MDKLYKAVVQHILATDPRPLDILIAICGPFHRDPEIHKSFRSLIDITIALPDALRELEEKSAYFRAGGTKPHRFRFSLGLSGQGGMILRGEFVD